MTFPGHGWLIVICPLPIIFPFYGLSSFYIKISCLAALYYLCEPVKLAYFVFKHCF